MATIDGSILKDDKARGYNGTGGSCGIKEVVEESAGALALIVMQPIGVEAVGNKEIAVSGLIRMMQCGIARRKENVVAALLELCRSGGIATTERVLKAPALAGLLQTLLFTGTKSARRKAACFVLCAYCLLQSIQCMMLNLDTHGRAMFTI